MKKLLIGALLCASFYSAQAGAPNVYEGKGRIALSSDGNKHDNDDMQATMLTLAILAHAELQNKTTLYTYADHVWGSEKDDLARMKISAEVCGERLGFDKTKFMAAVEDPEAAYEAMAKEILASSKRNPLFIIAAGPMQVVGEALSRASKRKGQSLEHVTVISHSQWNDVHSDNYEKANSVHGGEAPHSGWTWAEMKEAFGSQVNFNRISDQNGTGKNPYKTKDKFSAPSWAHWLWLKQSGNENWAWIYDTARKNPCGPDFSDAGMAYYLVADLEGERGDEMGNPEKLKRWMTQAKKK